MIRYLLVAIFISIVAAGCVPREPQKPLVILDPAAPCEEIVHPALMSVPFDQLEQGREETEEWIISQFPTTTVEFEPIYETGVEGIGQFYWSEGNKDFALIIVWKSKYIAQTSEPHPTLGAILRCYGDPMYYALDPQAVLGQAAFGYRLSIYYPDRGLEFRDSNWEATVAKRYDATSVMNDNIIVVPVGTAEETIRNVYGSNEYSEKSISFLQEWPDDFTQFVLEE